jgi:hypothetical protein
MIKRERSIDGFRFFVEQSTSLIVLAWLVIAIFTIFAPVQTR